MRKGKFNMRFYFAQVVLLGFLASTVLTFGIFVLLERLFEISLTLFSLIWILVGCSGITACIIYVLNRRFFNPINRLGEAMQDVADGNFKIKLECQSSIPNVQEIYKNFNRMTEELDKTEVLQEDFVSNVSHEFKTPISAIEGYAMLLQDTPQSPEQKEYVDRILSNTQRLSELIGNILLLSKVENQSLSTQQSVFALDEQIRQSIMLLESKWLEKEIELDVDLDPLDYCGSEGLMFQIWNNLIGNAIKFNKMGGLVRMRLNKTGDQICFTIEDEGPGIAPEEQKHIFDRFYQCDNSHRAEGNGLGLALVKRIVALCKGEILVENLPSAGVRFTVLLPAQSQQ